VWDLARPRLEREHEVLTPSLNTADPLAAAERALDEAGLPDAHVAGNSLGGYLALKLAERGRARSVVAFAPAGGDTAVLARQRAGVVTLRDLVAHPERVPREIADAQMLAWARFTERDALLDRAEREGWPLDAALVTCPVRVVWGLEDRMLPWPRAAERWRRAFPHAEWIELDGVGHCVPLDTPLETAELILGVSASCR
jgi:pimeloyl-ACP methyl ester carboxylesterase